jgi:hypothetical protein
MRVGPEKPKSEPKHGTSRYGPGLFCDQDGAQVAQLDDVKSGKGYGWWKFPAGTFRKD